MCLKQLARIAACAVFVHVCAKVCECLSSSYALHARNLRLGDGGTSATLSGCQVRKAALCIASPLCCSTAQVKIQVKGLGDIFCCCADQTASLPLGVKNPAAMDPKPSDLCDKGCKLTALICLFCFTSAITKAL